jgi:hypothetical protein
MFEFINQFVNYTVGIASWQLFTFCAVVCVLFGLLSLHVRRKRAHQYYLAGEYEYPWWPPVASIVATVLSYLVISYFTGHAEAKKLLITTAPTVIKDCNGCSAPNGKLAWSPERVGNAEEVKQNTYFVPVSDLTPVVVDRIEVLPVYPAQTNNNPRYGFNTHVVKFVVFSDVAVTNVLSRPFNRWEPLLVSLICGFLTFGLVSVFEDRRLRKNVVALATKD